MPTEREPGAAGKQASLERRPARLVVARGLLTASLLAASLLSYLRSLNFAFFNDDPTGNFAWMEGQSWTQLFTSAAGYGFYRPLPFAVWQALHATAGYAAPLFHGLSLFIHGLNVLLLGLLAYRLVRRAVYAWLAALLFAAMPFHYEAVAYVAAQFHPLLLFWTLLALLGYQQALATGRQRYLAAVHAVLVLALFSHENGLFVPLALLGLDWFTSQQRAIGRSLRRCWPFFIAPAFFVVLWLAIPKAGERALPSPARLGGNLLPFAQTLLYPLLPLVHRWVGSVAGLLGAATVVIAGMGLLAHRLGQLRLWLLALLWFGLSSLPAALFLDPGYVLGSPRLSYLPAAGVALFWALPVLALTGTAWRWGLALLLGLAIGLPPLRFVNCQLDFYAEASRIVREMAALATSAPEGATAVFANTPFFFSSYPDHPDGCPNPYPWTPTGAVVAPPYANLADFVRINGGAARRVESVTVPAYGPGWTTHGPPIDPPALRALVGDQSVFIFDLFGRRFYPLSAAWQPGAPRRPALARFGDLIALVEATVTPGGAPDELAISLSWQALDDVGLPYTAFVHLYDEAGTLVAQDDAPPAGNFAPTPFWGPGDLIRDGRSLLLPAALPPGRYQLVVGLYDSQTADRLPALVDGRRQPDDFYLLGAWEIP